MHTLLLIPLLLFSGTGRPESQPTPAETEVDHALTAIEHRPDHFQNYNALAMALARRARETANPEFYERGLGALRVSTSLEPENHGARRTEAWIRLGQHRFEEALEIAGELNRKVPDDLMVYGILVDGHMELGNYASAELACQWMLDLRPGNVPALTRAAYLREIFGDIEGALELMQQAFQRIPTDQREDRAWVLVHMAHLDRSRGELEAAANLAEAADVLFPDYHYALAELAAVRMDQGRAAEASVLLERRLALAPHPENHYDLALAQLAAGDAEAAALSFARFEEGALAESDGEDNANRQLIAYYLEHGPAREQDALRLARQERSRRGDVHTRELLAWALLENGRIEEAGREMEAALEVGYREKRLFLNAGRIALANGDREAARKHLEACSRLAGGSKEAREARRIGESLGS